MSSFIEVTNEQRSSKFSRDNQQNTNLPHYILKSKENIFKAKCNKALKNKLKKYKLRKDGKEDEDIINVSKTLISSLKIKSPNGQNPRSPILKTELEERQPKNYLFKMVRNRNEAVKTAKEGSPNILDSEHTVSPNLPEEESNSSKHTNAFKLLMDSRTKSIGGNSPGKDKILAVTDESEQITKKELKVKRNLVLQQMAQKKGLVKNQENEEFIDECIKRKLEKRADRLKEMITINISKKENKLNTKNSKIKDISDFNNGAKVEENMKILKRSKLQFFNFLSDDSVTESQNNCINKISNEDEEFLKKLGPSIRKKENMLSYFQKLEKKDTSVSGPEIEINDNNNSENSVIKVKVVAKSKQKKTEVKLKFDPKVVSVDLLKNPDEISVPKPDGNLNKDNLSGTPTRKRKRDKTGLIPETKENIKVHDEIINSRPKRNTKKPIKYSEDALLSSSDDEYIFTPIKRKNIKKDLDCKNELKNEAIIVSEINSKSKRKPDKSAINPKKNSTKTEIKDESKKSVKLAPIFFTKSKLTPSEQAAKESFLKSGVPEKLKIKLIENTHVVTWNNFYNTVHVQQNENKEVSNINTIPFKNVEWGATEDTKLISIDYDEHNFYSQLLNLPLAKNNNIKNVLKYKPEDLLCYMKKSYPKFPVYRTFHTLKTRSIAEIKDLNMSELDNSIDIVQDIADFSNDNPDKLSWNEKYRPMSSKQIIGNFECVKELKRWLECWNDNQNIKGKNDESDLSDFCFSDSDTNSRDPFKQSNNVLIMSGNSGTGKTSCVYAVAAELAIKVIEVNASSKRTGKIMLQDLQEATQSHKVNRGNNKKDSSQNSQSSQENITSSKIFKKRGRPKKTYERKSKYMQSKDIVEINSLSQQSQSSSQESSRTQSSLILIDDADIVFDQDDGFCSAVSQLINYSKRPVILVTSSLSCAHLHKYISFGKVIKMNPLLPRMLGTWLDIMCLADTNICVPGLGCRMLDYFRGDIRKSIFFLQFYMTSHKHLNEVDDRSQDTDFKVNIDDENSSMSWADHDYEGITKEVDDKKIKEIVDTHMISLNLHSYNLFNFWWNVSNQIIKKKIKNIENTSISIDDASRVLDNISFIDSIDINADCKANITSKPWMSFQSPSVVEKENMDSYNVMNELNRDISKEIIKISTSQLGNWEQTPETWPSMSTQRKRNKIVSQHNTLSKYLTASSTLDRRALALDYWSSCRTICRLEKNKTDNNLKRNNRFCHYLKSLNILCKNEHFDDLCEGLT